MEDRSLSSFATFAGLSWSFSSCSSLRDSTVSSSWVRLSTCLSNESSESCHGTCQGCQGALKSFLSLEGLQVLGPPGNHETRKTCGKNNGFIKFHKEIAVFSIYFQDSTTLPESLQMLRHPPKLQPCSLKDSPSPQRSLLEALPEAHLNLTGLCLSAPGSSVSFWSKSILQIGSCWVQT